MVKDSVRWSTDVAAPPERIWDFVADTDRMNRALGLPAVSYRYESDPKGGSRIFARAPLLFGISVEWREHPFEWTRPEGFEVQRVFDPRGLGPLLELRVGSRFERIAGGTRVHFHADFVAKNRIVAFGARLNILLLQKPRSIALCSRIGEQLKLPQVEPFVRQAAQSSSVAPERTAAMTSRLEGQGISPEMARSLLELASSRPDEELHRVRPFRLARELAIGRDQALSLLLRATRAGLFELSWDLLCPHCRGAKVRTGTLSEIRGQSRCDACNVDFEVDFDRSVELTFRLAASWRALNFADYCIGGPMRTPHRAAQARVPAGASKTIALELSEGAYAIRCPQSQGLCLIEAATDAPDHVRLEIGQSLPDSLTLRSGSAKLEIVNPLDHETLVSVDRSSWMDDACTAAQAACFQEFRDLFPVEVLRRGEEIRIGSIALLFTDLKGSTALYQEIGDGQAFALVQEHFKVLTRCVSRHEGAIVKTIGDAVMASFLAPENALAAAFDIQREILATFGSRVIVKVGVHFGPCFAVNLNERLDYFGSTVNLAARTEGQCRGGDITISAAMMRDPAVQACLDGEGVRAEKRATTLKGFAEEMELYWIDCAAISTDARPARSPRTGA